ncbi:hypothetical protein ACFV5J_35540 [Streptomyces zaomyceticus]
MTVSTSTKKKEGVGGLKGASPFVFLLGAAPAAHLRRLLELFVFSL